jgi:hypothetical protein
VLIGAIPVVAIEAKGRRSAGLFVYIVCRVSVFIAHSEKTNAAKPHIVGNI